MNFPHFFQINLTPPKFSYFPSEFCFSDCEFQNIHSGHRQDLWPLKFILQARNPIWEFRFQSWLLTQDQLTDLLVRVPHHLLLSGKGRSAELESWVEEAVLQIGLKNIDF